jgi:hypothetical protein
MTKESIPKARHRRSLTVGHITQANADSSLLDYEQFLQNKIAIDNGHGWAVEPHAIHPVLKPHQRDQPRRPRRSPECTWSHSHRVKR